MLTTLLSLCCPANASDDAYAAVYTAWVAEGIQRV